MDPTFVKAVVEGGAALVALFLLHGLSGRLGEIAGRLDTLVQLLQGEVINAQGERGG